MDFLPFYRIKKIENQVSIKIETLTLVYVYFNDATNSIWFSSNPHHVSEFDVFLGVL